MFTWFSLEINDLVFVVCLSVVISLGEIIFACESRKCCFHVEPFQFMPLEIYGECNA